MFSADCCCTGSRHRNGQTAWVLRARVGVSQDVTRASACDDSGSGYSLASSSVGSSWRVTTYLWLGINACHHVEIRTESHACILQRAKLTPIVKTVERSGHVGERPQRQCSLYGCTREQRCTRPPEAACQSRCGDQDCRCIPIIVRRLYRQLTKRSRLGMKPILLMSLRIPAEHGLASSWCRARNPSPEKVQLRLR